MCARPHHHGRGGHRLLATVATLATLTLVLPTFTTSTPCPEFSTEQLAFAAVASLSLYLLFVFVQTVRHREDFLRADTDADDPDENTAPPSSREALLSLGLLVVGLVAVVGLAEVGALAAPVGRAALLQSGVRLVESSPRFDSSQSHPNWSGAAAEG